MNFMQHIRDEQLGLCAGSTQDRKVNIKLAFLLLMSLLSGCGFGATNTVTATPATLEPMPSASATCVPASLSSSNTPTANMLNLSNAISAATAQGAGQAVCITGSGTVSGTLNITGSVKIIGSGQNVTLITFNDSSTTINITTIGAVEIDDLTFATAASNATAITVSPSAGENTGSRFNRVTFYGFYQSINFVAASTWIIDSCSFSAPNQQINNVAVTIENTLNADSGDSEVINSVFAGTESTNTTGLNYISSGGLRIENNKFNGVTYPILMNWGSGLASSDLLIIGNSIEGYLAGISLARTGAIGTFQNVVINDNQFASNVPGTQTIYVPSDTNGVWLSQLNISNNVFEIGSDSLNYAIVLNSINGFIEANNTINFLGSASNIAIWTSSTATNGVVGPNMITGTHGVSNAPGAGITTVAPY